MKKLYLAINIIFMALIACGIACYCVFAVEKIKVLTAVAILVIGAINLFNSFYQNSKNKKFSISWFVGIVFTAIGMLLISLKKDNTLQMNFPLAGIFLVLGIAGFVVLLIFKNGFKYTDCFYVAGIFIPVALLVIISSMFGFKNAFEAILSVCFILCVSCFVGKAFADLIKKQDVINILAFIASIFMFISYFLLNLSAFAYVHVAVLYVLIPCMYVAQIIIGYVLFHTTKFKCSILNSQEKMIKSDVEESNKLENKNSRFDLKRNILYSISLCLACVLACFSVGTCFVKNNVSVAKVSKKQFLEMVGDNLEIPLIEVNTKQGKIPHDKENYINCSFKLTNCDDEKYNFSVDMGETADGKNNVGLRLRGNSTFSEMKKPYRIKFAEKQSLFNLKKNKSWVLLADYFDQSYIRNFTAFTLASNVISTLADDDQYFAPTGHHVALIINGEFKGLYLLCEQMDENKGRVNVKDDSAFENIETKTDFPFFIEMDNQAFTEGVTGVDNFYTDYGFQPVEIKYPESDERGKTEATDKVFDYIKEYVNSVCYLLKYGGTVDVSFRQNPVSLEELVDIDSFVDYYLLTEITHCSDSIWKSIYMYKSTNGLLKIGPIWDFDYSMADTDDRPYKESYIETANNLFIAKHSAIFNNLFSYDGFYDKVTARYEIIKGEILKTADYLKTYKAKIDLVAKIDAKMWHGKSGLFEYDMQYDYVRLYLQDRYTYLDNVFKLSYVDFMAIINA